MPLLNLLLTSSSQQIELPSTIIAKHLHLKMVAVNLSAAAHADDVGMEIRLPFLHHGYNISSSYGRSNLLSYILTLCSWDLPCTNSKPSC